MKTSTAVKVLGSKYAIAATLGISRQAVGKWGALVPAHQAIRLQEKTNGALKIVPELYK